MTRSRRVKRSSPLARDREKGKRKEIRGKRLAEGEASSESRRTLESIGYGLVCPAKGEAEFRKYS